jgi:hypothetical protein
MACNGEGTVAGSGPNEGGTGGDSTVGDIEAGRPAADAGTDEDADAGCPWYPPSGDPPRSVTFVLTNASATPRFVITGSDDTCHPYTVDDLDVTGTWAPCFFEGADAGGQAFVFSAIAPDASVSVSWDGLQTVVQNGVMNCGLYVPEPTGCVQTTYSVRKAMAPGAHIARFGVALGSPSCGLEAGPPPFECVTPPGAATGGTCDPALGGVPSTTLEVPFALPDAGPLTIHAAVP